MEAQSERGAIDDSLSSTYGARVLPDKLISAGLDLVARLPQNAVSRAVGKLSRTERPRPLSRLSVSAFAKAMNIAVHEAERPLEEYKSVHDFFVRKLRAGARRIDQRSEIMVSPCDGVVGACGRIESSTLVQAKGRSYSLTELLKKPGSETRYVGGYFATIYLSPRHYHRVHSPVSGEVVTAEHVPGQLLPVNRPSIHHFDGVFVKNERLTTYVASEQFGEVAVVMVGATCVGEMSASYDPSFVTNQGGAFRLQDYSGSPTARPALNKGHELGIFHMGSTVVLVMEKSPELSLLVKEGEEVLMGAPLYQQKTGAPGHRTQASTRKGGAV